MSCVWKGLIKKLNLQYKPLTLYNVIKKNNIRTHNVLHNGTKPSPQQLDENFERIERLTQKEVLDGYLCSSFDPLLFLICELYKVNIKHKYCNTVINYEYNELQIENYKEETEGKTKRKNKHKIKKNILIKKITCFSDEGHFW